MNAALFVVAGREWCGGWGVGASGKDSK